MNRARLHLVGALALLVVPLVLGEKSSAGAEPSAKTAPAADVAVKTDSQPASKAENPSEKPAAEIGQEKLIREQSIYIPYEKLRKVFEKEGRGVFLPYEKFQELWQAAQEKTKPAAAPKPPVASLITESDNEATVAKDVVRVKARLKVEILAEGWTEVPLRLADAAITAATLAGQPARVVAAGDAGYKLLIEKKGKQPEQLELVLDYAKAITRSPGQNSVSFQAPQTPVSRWKVRIPEPGVKVNVQPLIAATEAPAAEGAASDAAADKKAKPAAKPDETVILAFVGAAPSVRIEWTPKAEGATGLEALASVQTEQQVWINEGVVRTRTQLVYAISRAELGQLAFEVPAGQKVVNVFDANVRQWSVQTADNKQKVTVQLFEPAKGSQNLTVELEEFIGQQRESKVSAPVIRALGVGRQQGVLVVQVAEGLRAEIGQSSGLLQVDRAELPPALAQGKWAFSYRYSAIPYELVLNVEKVQPRIVVDSLVEAELRPERLTLSMLAIYTIERAGVFRLDLDVPAGFEVRQVRGRAAAGAAEALVDGYYLEGDQKTHLVVNLGRKALGRVGLELELIRELHEPDLLTPTGKSIEIGIGIPQVAAAKPQAAARSGDRPQPEKAAAAPKAADAKPGEAKAKADVPPPKPGAAKPAPAALVAPAHVEHFSGRVLIYAPESLRVNPDKNEGLRSVSFQEALEGMESLRGGKTADARPVLAFAFAQDPTTLSLTAERRKPQVTVRQFLVVRVEDVAVKYSATFFYEILYSGVKSLRIDVPAEVSGLLRNNSRAIRDRILDPQPAGVEKGYTAWSFSGETELIGGGKIELLWEKKLDKLDVGATLPLAIPRLKPMDVDRTWGQIVLTKTETIDLNDPEKLHGLRPIDPQYDLMPGAAASGAARAFEFQDDWSLTIPATRYDLQEIKSTSIERAVVRMVVTRARKISVQALYRIRSVRQRLELKLPKGVTFESQQYVNGKPFTPETGQKGEYLVPVSEPNADKSFLLELRYTLDGDGSELVCPEFPQEPAAQKVYLAVYLPQEKVLLDRRGPWTEQFRWRLQSGLKWGHENRISEQELVDWVAQPIRLAETFQTDGRMYVFSALALQTGPKGALRLTVLHENWLNFGLIAGMLAIGLLLLPVRAGGRALVMGVLIVGIVLAGVFLPILAHQILGGVLAAALLVVLVAWVVRYLMQVMPRQSAALSGSPPPAEPAKPADKDAPSNDQGGPSHA